MVCVLIVVVTFHIVYSLHNFVKPHGFSQIVPFALRLRLTLELRPAALRLPTPLPAANPTPLPRKRMGKPNQVKTKQGKAKVTVVVQLLKCDVRGSVVALLSLLRRV